jgi:hypothetical protein
MLRSGTEWIRGALPEIATLRAEILETNVASQRIFASAGYVQSENPQVWFFAVRGEAARAAPGAEGVSR